MIIRNTILLPSYRYIFNVLAQYQSDYNGIIEEIKSFEEKLRHYAEKIKSNEWGCNSSNQEFRIIEDTLKIIRLIYKDNRKEEAKKKLETEILKLKDGSNCGLCVVCHNCQLYFLKSLCDYLFNTKHIKEGDVYFSIREIPDEIRKHLITFDDVSKIYFDNAQISRTKNGIKNKLIILKGFSSSTPAILNGAFDTDIYTGGGLYLRWNGYGIAIDPGYHFVKNMHHYGLTVLDINMVIITHEHIDHNADMRLIDDINYAVNRHLKEGHKIMWLVDKVTFQMMEVLQKSESGFNRRINDIKLAKEPDDKYAEYLRQEKGIEIECFQTEHVLLVSGQYALHTFGCGFKLRMDNKLERRLVYTSDTRCCEPVIKACNEADILIANISSVYEDDFMLVNSKKKHLGYSGCYQLLKNYYNKNKKFPQFFLISEFWNSTTDIRYDITKNLDQRIHQFFEIEPRDCRIFPGEVGTVLDIENGSIQCSRCKKFTTDFVVQNTVDLNDKIEILCKDCIY